MSKLSTVSLGHRKVDRHHLYPFPYLTGANYHAVPQGGNRLYPEGGLFVPPRRRLIHMVIRYAYER